MKIKVIREEIIRAYNELMKCPCCGEIGDHTCGCSPEIYEQRKEEIILEVESYDH